MTMLIHTITEEIVLLRMSITENNKMAYSTVTSIDVTIQPLDDEKNSIAEGVFGKTFTCYTNGDISLLPGDRLRDDDNNFYTIKSGGSTRRQHGRIGYSKIIIELTD